jgi:hypothetical protein
MAWQDSPVHERLGREPGEAEPRVPALLQFWRFWTGRHPFSVQQSPSLPWYAALWLAALGVGYAVAIVGAIAVTAVDGSPPDNSVATFLTNNSATTVLLLAVVLAPIWEELAFRLPVSGAPWTVAVGGSLLFAFSLPALAGVSPTGWLGDEAPSWVHLAAALGEMLVLGAALWGITMVCRRRFPGRRPGHHPFKLMAAIVLTALFAIAHLSNFGEVTTLTPMLVVPQLLLGLVIMFARVNHSWWLGLGIHGANNLLAVSVGLAGRGGTTAQAIAAMFFLMLVGGGAVVSISALLIDTFASSRSTQPSAG